MENRVVEMKPVSLFEVKEIVKERKSNKEKELNYEQEQTLNHIDKFAKLTEKQTTDLIEKLKAIEFIKENDFLLYQIVNVVPVKVEQLQLMLPKNITPTEEELKQVIELTSKHADKYQ